MVLIILKDVLKCVTIKNGELFVITPGVQMMALLLVINWHYHMYQLLQMHIMDKEKDKFGWEIYCAQDRSINWQNAPIMDLDHMIADIMKMLALSATVSEQHCTGAHECCCSPSQYA